MFNALGGSQPSAVQQPSAPPPPGSPGVGGGSLFEALQQQLPQHGDNQPLQLGPEIASNNPIPVNVRTNISKDFGQKAPAPIQRGVGSNTNPDDYENKANAVMNAKQAQAMREHPEWFK